MKRDAKQVSKAMRSVHSKDTNIEMTLRRALWKKGYRYRKNLANLPGKPDIAFTKYKLAVFCDSEFWHGRDWEHLKEQLQKGNNPDYWINKIERNRSRDVEIERKLRALGWTVLRFWGKEILFHTDECVRTVEETIFEIRLEQICFDFSTDEFETLS